MTEADIQIIDEISDMNDRAVSFMVDHLRHATQSRRVCRNLVLHDDMFERGALFAIQCAVKAALIESGVRNLFVPRYAPFQPQLSILDA